MKDKLTGKINNETLTMCINQWADSANFKGIKFNKICSGLTGKCFEMPNASYTKRQVFETFSNGQNTQILDLSNSPKGNYVLSIGAELKNYSEKIILQ